MVYKYKPRKRVQKKRQRAPLARALVNSKLVEQKRHRGIISASVLSATTIASVLSGNSQGLSDLNNRIGDVINITKLEFAYSALLSDSTNVLRLILFLYKDMNITAPDEGAIFDDSSSMATKLYGPLNEDNIKGGRIKVLMDKRIILYNSKNFVGGYIKRTFRGLAKTTFSGGSTTYGRNMPYFAFVSDSTAVSHPQLEIYHTTHYTDL